MLSIQELRSSTKKELLEELSSARSELQKIKISVKTKNAKDSSTVGKQRTYVAQVITIIKDLELEEMVKKANIIE